MVQVEGNLFHSIQVDGPVLPHGLRQMSSLLNKDRIQYSISVSTAKQMTGFTQTSKQFQETGTSLLDFTLIKGIPGLQKKTKTVNRKFYFK